MNNSFDYFVAALHCPKCGEVSPADDSTCIQTKIQVNASLTWLGVGSVVELDDDIESAGYYPIATARKPGELILLEQWECPFCDKPNNWLRIKIVKNKIESMENVLLTKTLLKNSNYISDESIDEARLLDSKLSFPSSAEKVMRVLLEKLPE